MDTRNEHCAWYAQHPDKCGKNDDDDFSAGTLCCECGGGDSSILTLASEKSCVTIRDREQQEKEKDVEEATGGSAPKKHNTTSNNPDSEPELPQHLVFEAAPIVVGGMLQGHLRIAGSAVKGTLGPLPLTVLIDAYAFNGSATSELVFTEAGVNVEFSLPMPMETFSGQTVRVDAYPDPLPLQIPGQFYRDDYDGMFDMYNSQGQLVFTPRGLVSTEVYVSPAASACVRTLTTNTNSTASGTVYTGTNMEFVLTQSSDSCTHNASATLFLVDSGVAVQDSYEYPELHPQPPALDPALSFVGRVTLRDDVTLSTGVAPSCVSQLPARISISGWGLAMDGNTPPTVTVGEHPCKVIFVVVNIEPLFCSIAYWHWVLGCERVLDLIFRTHIVV